MDNNYNPMTNDGETEISVPKILEGMIYDPGP